HLAQLARLDPASQAGVSPSARGLSFFGTLRVPAGRYTVRLMVQERETGAAGVQFIDVSVPPYDPRAGFLLPPLAVDEAARWLGLEMSRARTAGVGTPFEVAGRPFGPRASFQVQPGTPEKMVLIAYEPAAPGDPAADVQIRSSVTDRQGRPVAPGLMHIDKVHRDESGRRTYVLAYTPETLAPGDYTLRIAVGEAGSHAASYALLRVR